MYLYVAKAGFVGYRRAEIPDSTYNAPSLTCMTVSPTAPAPAAISGKR